VSRKYVSYAVLAKWPDWWVVGFEYTPVGKEPEQDAIRIAPGAWALLQREPFVWPSAGPFTWPNGSSAAHVAMQLGGIVMLAPAPPERPAA
jgi:hypothetical protein